MHNETDLTILEIDKRSNQDIPGGIVNGDIIHRQVKDIKYFLDAYAKEKSRADKAKEYYELIQKEWNSIYNALNEARAACDRWKQCAESLDKANKPDVRL